MSARHCPTCTCGCTCGYGGQHEPSNVNCDLYDPDEGTDARRGDQDGGTFIDRGTEAQTGYFHDERDVWIPGEAQ